jgi:hypothetical protein
MTTRLTYLFQIFWSMFEMLSALVISQSVSTTIDSKALLEPGLHDVGII